jgi:DNA-binding GntR family transcriptional regulator
MHFEALRVASKGNDDIGRFLTLCDNEAPHEYIHKAIANAVISRNVAEAIRLLNAHINHTSELVSQITRQYEAV